jgi:NitT/TauT family transport system substrate-binding protein
MADYVRGGIEMRKMMGFAVVVTALFGFAPDLRADTMTLAHSTWVGYGPFYIARDKGFFEDEGVEIELQIMENTPLKMGALMAGQVDLVASTADEFPIYMKPGTPLKYILAVDNSNGGDGVVSNKEIKSVAGLKGKKVAFEEGSVSQFYGEHDGDRCRRRLRGWPGRRRGHLGAAPDSRGESRAWPPPRG